MLLQIEPWEQVFMKQNNRSSKELYLLEVDLDPVHGVVVDKVCHVAEGLGLLQGV